MPSKLMEFPQLDLLGDEHVISPTFTRLSKNQSNILLNDIAERRGGDLVDLTYNDVYSYRILKDITLRASSTSSVIHTDQELIDEGYIMYNSRTKEIAFCNIHKVEGDLFSYQIEYSWKIIDGIGGLSPVLVVYQGIDSLRISMRLDGNGNIIQVYNVAVPSVTRREQELALCESSGLSPGRSLIPSGQFVIGSKDIDVMTALTYILAHEVELLKLVGNLMIRYKVINEFSI